MGLILGSGQTRPQYPYDMWYGIQGDFTSSDYNLTRIGNMGLHQTLPIQKKLRRFVENTDGSVKYYLHANDSRKKDGGAAAVIDGSDGNVMLEKPEYYFRLEIEGTKWARAYSEYPLPGFIKMERKTISPWYASYNAAGNGVVSGCWLTWDGDEIARDSNGLIIFANGAPRGGNGTDWDDTYRSLIGMPKTNVAKATVRAKCADGIHIGAYRAYNEIAWLQRLEYASLNCQATYNATLDGSGYHQGGLGNGPAVTSSDWNSHNSRNPFVPCGVTATLGNNTGRLSFLIKNWKGGGTDKTVQVTSYRGLETPFEYLNMFADDLLVWHKQNADSTIYVCEDPTKFTSHSDNASTIPDGYGSVTQLPRGDGYALTYDHSEKGYSFPNQVGGSENTGTCDYFYTSVDDETPGYGWYGALLSGSAGNGAYAGFGFLFTNYRSSLANAHFGFRLCRN